MDKLAAQEVSLRRALHRKLVAPIADEAGFKLSKVKGTQNRE